MIHRILPKGTRFDELIQDDINRMMNQINSYKRKKLNNRSPHETFSFDQEAMDITNMEKYIFDNTSWTDYAMVEPESGEIMICPYKGSEWENTCVTLILDANGIGWFEMNDGVNDITWGCDDEHTLRITREDGRNYYMTSYASKKADDNPVWLLLELDERLVWMH